MSRFSNGSVRALIGIGFGAAALFCVANGFYIGTAACALASYIFVSKGVKTMMNG